MKPQAFLFMHTACYFRQISFKSVIAYLSAPAEGGAFGGLKPLTLITGAPVNILLGSIFVLIFDVLTFLI